MSEESYFTCIPEISNVIARDITSAIAYLHGKDIDMTKDMFTKI